MAKIVLVHGMRMETHDRAILQARWRAAVLRGLKATAWGAGNPHLIPAKEDIALVYWGEGEKGYRDRNVSLYLRAARFGRAWYERPQRRDLRSIGSQRFWRRTQFYCDLHGPVAAEDREDHAVAGL